MAEIEAAGHRSSRASSENGSLKAICNQASYMATEGLKRESSTFAKVKSASWPSLERKGKVFYVIQSLASEVMKNHFHCFLLLRVSCKPTQIEGEENLTLPLDGGKARVSRYGEYIAIFFGKKISHQIYNEMCRTHMERTV